MRSGFLALRRGPTGVTGPSPGKLLRGRTDVFLEGVQVSISRHLKGMDARRANSPSGAFVVETKHWSGVATVKGVRVCSGARVAKVIASEMAVLGEDEVNRYVRSIRECLRSTSPPTRLMAARPRGRQRLCRVKESRSGGVRRKRSRR